MLKGKNIKLRALEPEDLGILYDWENNPENWLISGTMVPFSKHVLKEYLQTIHQDLYSVKQLRLVIDCMIDGKVKSVGFIDIFDFDPTNKRAGVGLLIASPADRKKGYATEALEVLIKYCFETLDLHQLFANVMEGNEGSLKLFQNQGFEIIGLKKDWIYDRGNFIGEYLLQKIRKED